MKRKSFERKYWNTEEKIKENNEKVFNNRKGEKKGKMYCRKRG